MWRNAGQPHGAASRTWPGYLGACLTHGWVWKGSLCFIVRCEIFAIFCDNFWRRKFTILLLRILSCPVVWRTGPYHLCAFVPSNALAFHPSHAFSFTNATKVWSMRCKFRTTLQKSQITKNANFFFLGSDLGKLAKPSYQTILDRVLRNQAPGGLASTFCCACALGADHLCLSV